MPDPTTILITGSSGFVGARLCRLLADRGHRVRAACRKLPDSPPYPGIQPVAIGDIGPQTPWLAALQGVQTVIHLASRVHQMEDRSTDPLADYRRINTLGTQRLAQQCVEAGVRRLVFASTVKVNGEGGDRPFREDDPPAPRDPYGLSKHEAEQALGGMTELETVIVRPPLVYGPGVKGNVLRLLGIAHRGVPLPLGRVTNRRSMVGLGNLCDFLACCATHPAAAGQVFLISDGEDLSTPDLIRRLAALMKRPARLLPVPVILLRLAGRLLGKREEIDRLTGSLLIDSTKARTLLAWSPPVKVDAQLAEMVEWYCRSEYRL